MILACGMRLAGLIASVLRQRPLQGDQISESFVSELLYGAYPIERYQMQRAPGLRIKIRSACVLLDGAVRSAQRAARPGRYARSTSSPGAARALVSGRAWPSDRGPGRDSVGINPPSGTPERPGPFYRPWRAAFPQPGVLIWEQSNWTTTLETSERDGSASGGRKSVRLRHAIP
jgi:hypothetical protein